MVENVLVFSTLGANPTQNARSCKTTFVQSQHKTNFFDFVEALLEQIGATLGLPLQYCSGYPYNIAGWNLELCRLASATPATLQDGTWNSAGWRRRPLQHCKMEPGTLQASVGDPCNTAGWNLELCRLASATPATLQVGTWNPEGSCRRPLQYGRLDTLQACLGISSPRLGFCSPLRSIC